MFSKASHGSLKQAETNVRIFCSNVWCMTRFLHLDKLSDQDLITVDPIIITSFHCCCCCCYSWCCCCLVLKTIGCVATNSSIYTVRNHFKIFLWPKKLVFAIHSYYSWNSLFLLSKNLSFFKDRFFSYISNFILILYLT
jgi:hypothetical protein